MGQTLPSTSTEESKTDNNHQDIQDKEEDKDSGLGTPQKKNKPSPSSTGGQNVQNSQNLAIIPNRMEDYLKQAKLYGCFYSLDRRDHLMDEDRAALIKEFRQRLRTMRLQPQKYFNFGFSVNDYMAFINKHYFMRLERDMVKRSGEGK